MIQDPQVSTLSNGLRVVSRYADHVETVSFSVWVGVGSRYETEELNGISHFLEHMAFKGTDRRSPHDIALAFDSIGGHYNAFTSREHTVFYAKVLKDDLEVAADVIADILQNSLFLIPCLPFRQRT